MSGIRARQGFRYQDAVLIERLLRDVVALRRAEIEGASPPQGRTFALESSPRATTGPDWDIIEITSPAPTLVLEEVKSGRVDADDRRALWKRIRRSLGSLPVGAVPLVRLLVDRECPPTLHGEWPAMRVSAFTATIPSVAPTPVTSAGALAQEALFYLTMPGADDKSPGIPEDIARALLAQFEYDASNSRATAEQQVKELLGQVSSELGIQELSDAIHGYVESHAFRLSLTSSALDRGVWLRKRRRDR